MDNSLDGLLGPLSPVLTPEQRQGALRQGLLGLGMSLLDPGPAGGPAPRFGASLARGLGAFNDQVNTYAKGAWTATQLQKELDREAAFKNLVGTPGVPATPAEPDNYVQLPNQPAVPGTGYLGGNMKVPEFAARTAALGGPYMNAGLNMLMASAGTKSLSDIGKMLTELDSIKDPGARAAYMRKLFPPVVNRGYGILNTPGVPGLAADPASEFQIGRSEALKTGARTANAPLTVQGPSGEPVTGYGGNILGAPPIFGGAQPTFGAPTAQPAPVGVRGQTTEQKTYLTEASKAGSEYENKINTDAESAVQQNRMLDELQQSFNEFTPGKAAAIRKSLAEWKVQLGLGSESDKRIAASGEVGDKLTGQIVSQALRKMSARPSQMEFYVFLQKFVPNLEMTPQGAQAVIEFMRQQSNLPLEKQREFQQYKGTHSPSQYRDFESAWNPQEATAPLRSGASFTGGAPKEVDFHSLPQP